MDSLESVRGGCFFFFQAEDGIRDYKVTGVQTCALPICPPQKPRPREDGEGPPRPPQALREVAGRDLMQGGARREACDDRRKGGEAPLRAKIGRASCRERV